MAWYNGGLGAGVWEGLPIDPHVKNIMAQVCTAINERQAAMAYYYYTETEWNVFGTTKARPVAADFVGMTMHAAAYNMTTIRSSINSIQGLVDKWTLADRSAYLPHPAIPVPARIGDYAFWNAAKLALEDIRYPLYSSGYTWGGVERTIAGVAYDYSYGAPSAKYMWKNIMIPGGPNADSPLQELDWLWWRAISDSGIFGRICPQYKIFTDAQVANMVGTYIDGYAVMSLNGHANQTITMDITSAGWEPSQDRHITSATGPNEMAYSQLNDAAAIVGINIPTNFPFDAYPNATGEAQAEFIQGHPSTLGTTPSACCVFTELEVGTHLTYG